MGDMFNTKGAANDLILDNSGKGNTLTPEAFRNAIKAMKAVGGRRMQVTGDMEVWPHDCPCTKHGSPTQYITVMPGCRTHGHLFDEKGGPVA